MWMIEQIEVDPEQRGRYVMDLCEGGLQTRRISVDESTLGQFLMRKGMEMDINIFTILQPIHIAQYRLLPTTNMYHSMEPILEKEVIRPRIPASYRQRL